MRSFFLFGLVLGACVSDNSMPSGPAQGELGGPCFSDGKCKSGLECVVPNKCVLPEAGAADTGDNDSSMMGTDASDAAQQEGGDGGPACIGGTIAWWKCDGDFTDSVGTFNLTGNALAQPGGQVGGRWTFSGGAHLDFSTMLAPAVVSIEGWFNPDVDASQMTTTSFVFHAGSAGDVTKGWGITYTAGTHTFNFIVNDTSIITSKTVMPSSWVHIAFVFDGNSQTITSYTNAATNGPASVQLSSLPFGNSPRIRFGANAGDASQGWAGSMDEVAIFGKVLSANDINLLIANEKSMKPTCRVK